MLKNKTSYLGECVNAVCACVFLPVRVHLKGFLWFHVSATQGGYEPLTSLGVVRVRAPPKNRNLPSRRRSSKGCDWSAY